MLLYSLAWTEAILVHVKYTNTIISIEVYLLGTGSGRHLPSKLWKERIPGEVRYVIHPFGNCLLQGVELRIIDRVGRGNLQQIHLNK